MAQTTARRVFLRGMHKPTADQLIARLNTECEEVGVTGIMFIWNPPTPAPGTNAVVTTYHITDIGLRYELGMMLRTNGIPLEIMVLNLEEVVDPIGPA